jgi:hypothetical protein
MDYEDNSGFYRTELDGTRIAVSFDEIHELRKDILLYIDENIGEIIGVLLLPSIFNKPYWKFLSIDFTQEWAESTKYQKVIEEGCLAILNGIALDLLDQPVYPIPKSWQETDLNTILSYLNHYNPKTDRLKIAKSSLLQTYTFIASLTFNDLDKDGMLVSFNPAERGRWFDKEIVQAYYKWRLESSYRHSP